MKKFLIIVLFLVFCLPCFAQEVAELEISCKELENRISNLLDQVKECKVDEDCIFDTSFNLVCPFGYYFIHNKWQMDGEYLSLIEERVKEYAGHCPLCPSEWTSPPKQEEIICHMGKGADKRVVSLEKKSEKADKSLKRDVKVDTDQSLYLQGDTIRYTVKNGLSKDIFVMKGQHNLNFIEQKQQDGSWKNFGLTKLPEEPPPSGWEPYENIPPEGEKVFERYLGWLIVLKNNKQIDFMPETYRLIIEYKFQKDEKGFQERKSNEFELIN